MQAQVEKGPPVPQMSSRGLIASVISDAQRLVALEVALAKQEAKELATTNAIALGAIAFGGFLALLAILVAVPVLVVVLVPWKWQAAAIWAVAYLLVGLVMVLAGKARLQLRLPPKTIESLKENKEWALRRVRSNGR
jgi:Putative Actinobacterial Holin-X, holin superfamily III